MTEQQILADFPSLKPEHIRALPRLRRRAWTAPRWFHSGVKLQFDENLSSRLVEQLARGFPGSAHVDALGLHGKSDAELSTHAREHDLVIASARLRTERPPSVTSLRTP